MNARCFGPLVSGLLLLAALLTGCAKDGTPSALRASGRAVTFNSTLSMAVMIRVKPSAWNGVGRTPAATPLTIPADTDWLVNPDAGVPFDAVLAEMVAQSIPGLNLAVRTPAEWNTRAAALETLPHLRVLIVWGPGMTDAGLSRLARLRGLQVLLLSGSELTNAGLAQLANLQGLKTLILCGPHITDAGLDHLARLQGLEALNVEQTMISYAGVAKLRKALPHCAISP